MKRIFVSIFALIIGPVLSWAASIIGGPPGKLSFYCHGVHIHCTAEQKEFVEEALNSVVEYFDDAWPKYKSVVKRIILNEGIDTFFLIPYRTIIVKMSDINRMRSVRCFSAQLVADYERIKTFRDNWSSIIIWGSRVVDLAEASAVSARQKYLGLKE
ncbi:MAG: hypothetical protein GXY61_01960 [Lentisphaerae bacterium]|nr:hypothetical protein [Lentisphaerota bacterium]